MYQRVASGWGVSKAPSYCAAVAAASTASRSCRMTAPGSAAPKMALPATMALAPAAAAAWMVSGARPPSTCSRQGGARREEACTCMGGGDGMQCPRGRHAPQSRSWNGVWPSWGAALRPPPRLARAHAGHSTLRSPLCTDLGSGSVGSGPAGVGRDAGRPGTEGWVRGDCAAAAWCGRGAAAPAGVAQLPLACEGAGSLQSCLNVCSTRAAGAPCPSCLA